MSKKYMRDYAYTFDAGQTITATVRGNAFHIVTAESPVKLRFDNGKQATRWQGMGAAFETEYSDVEISSETAQTIIITLGYGEMWDSRASITGSIGVSIDYPNVITPKAEVSIGAGATVQVAGVDATRRALRIGVKSTEAGGVYFGDSATGATTEGGYIEQGGADYVEITGAVSVYNPNASAVVVNLLELKKV